MSKPSPWPVVHAERQALADDLARLDAAQWTTPSLCSRWTVHQTLGHMVAAAKTTPATFFAGLARSGFRFETLSAKNIARETSGSPAETLQAFRARISATTHPPGPSDTMLGETIVHSEDIRRPLGISHAYPVAAVTRAADFFASSNLLIGGKKRITGLTLRADDADWSTGDGAEVSGPALSLLMAITGRTAALDDLSGQGLATLRSRM